MTSWSLPVACLIACLAGYAALGAPVPPRVDANLLVERLGDSSPQVRMQSLRMLQDRTDALPWLRRATHSKDKNSASLAFELLEPRERKHQLDAGGVIDLMIRENRIDLVVEWHQYWRPEKPDDLWSVGPRTTKAGLELHAKHLPPNQNDPIGAMIGKVNSSGKPRFYDFANGFDPRRTEPGVWHVRGTDFFDASNGNVVAFANVAGLIKSGYSLGVQHFVLGSMEALGYNCSFLFCEGDIGSGIQNEGKPPRGVMMWQCVVVCRGNLCGQSGTDSVLLVDGNIDLSQQVGPRAPVIRNSLIRASGEILLPKGVELIDCTIEAHAKNPTAPYKFFDFAQVGLSVADDEEGLVVTGLKAETPFGNCGLAKGDIIRAIDDVPAGHSEEFRKKVRRALVRQGDCLITVTRGSKSLDLPVFFPLPK